MFQDEEELEEMGVEGGISMSSDIYAFACVCYEVRIRLAQVVHYKLIRFWKDHDWLSPMEQRTASRCHNESVKGTKTPETFS